MCVGLPVHVCAKNKNEGEKFGKRGVRGREGRRSLVWHERGEGRRLLLSWRVMHANGDEGKCKG